MSVTVIVDVRYALKPLWYLPAPLDNLERFLFFFFEYVFMSCRSIMLKMHRAVQDARSGCTERNRGHGGFGRTIWMKSYLLS